MTQKEKELWISGVVALLIFVALILLISPHRGKAPAAPTPTLAPVSPAVALVTPTPAPTAEPRDYVLNKSSKRFHYPDCASVPEIREKNREDVFASRDELIDRGFKPCGNCKP